MLINYAFSNTEMIILVVSLIISSLETYVPFAKLIFQNYFCHSLKSSTLAKWATKYSSD